MKAIRRAVAMTLVATALCADRAVASPQALCPRPQATGTLAGRISGSLRRCVPAIRLVEVRRDQDRPSVTALPAAPVIIVEPVAYSPFQFRLPPPLI
jgi:hypothetical protein